LLIQLRCIANWLVSMTHRFDRIYDVTIVVVVGLHLYGVIYLNARARHEQREQILNRRDHNNNNFEAIHSNFSLVCLVYFLANTYV